jgi:hypothetical protein
LSQVLDADAEGLEPPEESQVQYDADMLYLREAFVEQLIGNDFFGMVDAVQKGEDIIDEGNQLLLYCNTLVRCISQSTDPSSIGSYLHAVVKRTCNGFREVLDPRPPAFKGTAKTDLDWLSPLELKNEDPETNIAYHPLVKAGKAIQRCLRDTKKGCIWLGVVQETRLHSGAAESRGDEMLIVENKFRQVAGIIENIPELLDPVEMAPKLASALLVLEAVIPEWQATEPIHRAALRANATRALNNVCTMTIAEYTSCLDRSSTENYSFFVMARNLAKAIGDSEGHQAFSDLVGGLSESNLQLQMSGCYNAGVNSIENAKAFHQTYLLVKDAPRSTSEKHDLHRIRVLALEVILRHLPKEAQGDAGSSVLIDAELEILQDLKKDAAFNVDGANKKGACVFLTRIVSVVVALRDICASSIKARDLPSDVDLRTKTECHVRLAVSQIQWKKEHGKEFNWPEDMSKVCNELVSLGSHVAIGEKSGIEKQLQLFSSDLIKASVTHLRTAYEELALCAGAGVLPGQIWSFGLDSKASKDDIMSAFDLTLGHADFKGQVMDLAHSKVSQAFFLCIISARLTQGLRVLLASLGHPSYIAFYVDCKCS